MKNLKEYETDNLIIAQNMIKSYQNYLIIIS